MTIPSVSILLPVRNEEEFLPAALDSLFRQTWRDWELIVVDDGSDDSTPAILAEAATRDPRLKVVQSSGTGLVAALTAGLAACRAQLVARMDGDDICHPHRLTLQYAFMNSHPEIGLSACNFRHFPRHSIKGGLLAYETWQNSLTSNAEIARDLFVESPFVHPSVMFRKSVVEAVGGYRDMGWPEDYDLWLRLAAAGIQFARLPEALFFWRDRPGRATRTLPEYTAQAFRECKAHHLANGFLKNENSVILAGAGLEGRSWCRTLQRVGIRVACWLDVDPRKIGRQLHGAPVLAADDLPAERQKLLITVGTRGARQELRNWANGKGLRDGVDYLCVT